MNKQELAKEIELQEERLQQLKKEYIEKSKPNVKVGQCFSKWNFINTVYYKVIGINNDNVRPIKVIRVVKNRNIDIIELYLEDYGYCNNISREEFDKPDKPLNAWNTCLKYYPEWKLYVENVLVKYKISK